MGTKKVSKKVAPKPVKGKKVAPKPVKPVDPAKLQKQVLAAFTEVGYAALKANGVFTFPGWAKFVVKKTKARKAGKGINPFTKEPCLIKARPAGKTVKARAIKLVKNAV